MPKQEREMMLGYASACSWNKSINLLAKWNALGGLFRPLQECLFQLTSWDCSAVVQVHRFRLLYKGAVTSSDSLQSLQRVPSLHGRGSFSRMITFAWLSFNVAIPWANGTAGVVVPLEFSGIRNKRRFFWFKRRTSTGFVEDPKLDS